MVPPNLPLQKGNRILFCVMVSEYQAGEWHLEKVYTHAETVMQALANYRATIPRNMIFKVIGVAPVVGLKCDDNGGNITV